MATLYVIATPIGNLGDITARSLEVLNSVDSVICEDTRTTGFLLQKYNIRKPLISFHAHNEHSRVEQVLQALSTGNDIALVSDAGMPGISDPGFLLVREAHLNNITVSVLPGASAAITALVASGLPSDRFCFEGFLPQKKGRKSRMQALADEERTMIFFESPFRILKLIDECIQVFGQERMACIARELTKKFEEINRGKLSDLKRSLVERPSIKGEFVLIVSGLNYTE